MMKKEAFLIINQAQASDENRMLPASIGSKEGSAQKTGLMQQKEEGKWFTILIAGACIITGLLAGAGADRYIVQVPAWRRVGVLNWAAYSRYAEFGNGLFFYPFEVLGSFILLFTLSAIVLMDKTRFRNIAGRIHLATFFSTIGLFFTFFTMPVMMKVQLMTNVEPVVQDAFDRFHFWGLLRAIAQFLSFCTCVWVFAKKSPVAQV
jgi:hypothetical protein